VPNSIVNELRHFVGGQIILANLSQALEDKLICPNKAKEYHTRANRLLYSQPRRKRRTVDEVLFQVWSAVWNSPADFQLIGPACGRSGHVAIILRSYSQISYLIHTELEGVPDPLELIAKTEKSPGAITRIECEGLARILSALDEDIYRLFITARIAKGSENRFLVWMSNVATSELKDMPNDERATRLRNWLALGHFAKDDPIFAFVSIDSHQTLMERCGVEARHPTIFDAINHPWFRSRGDGIDYPDDWPRAVDLEKALLGKLRGLDGGPEAVSTSLTIPNNFRCLFVGRARDTMPNPGGRFVEMLLDGKSIDEVADGLVAKLA
jgi:hypothetical protein